MFTYRLSLKLKGLNTLQNLTISLTDFPIKIVAPHIACPSFDWKVRSGDSTHQNKQRSSYSLKLAIHLSFLAFRHVRELFHEIANQSLYTSHNITDFVRLWFCEKLAVSSSLTFCENTDRLARTAKHKMRKVMARQFTKCHVYTSRFSHFANIFSHSRQFDDKSVAGFTHFPELSKWLILNNFFSLDCNLFFEKIKLI